MPYTKPKKSKFKNKNSPPRLRYYSQQLAEPSNSLPADFAQPKGSFLAQPPFINRRAVFPSPQRSYQPKDFRKSNFSLPQQKSFAGNNISSEPEPETFLSPSLRPNDPQRAAKTDQNGPGAPISAIRGHGGLLLSCWCGDTFADTVSAFTHCRDDHNCSAFLLLHRTLAQLLSVDHSEDADEDDKSKNAPIKRQTAAEERNGAVNKRLAGSEPQWPEERPYAARQHLLNPPASAYKERFGKCDWSAAQNVYAEKAGREGGPERADYPNLPYACPGCNITGNWPFIRSHLRTSGHLIGGAKCLCGYLCIEKQCMMEHFAKEKSGGHGVYNGTLYSATEFLVENPYQENIDLRDERYLINKIGEEKYLIGYR